ncbi:Aspartyl protease family protein [Thalictrum thalictroides]|uniref:Aspartyl protease family protein n=1 Tax=Thalictrum thalictroides TaxID=46969 RepID=A0A7J6VUL5_THATH|nr:Aspartyl protease family protein [Thalictrum thalictroides]
MAHRDTTIRGRRLAATQTTENQQNLFTFADGNETVRISSLGFLHYANVSLGTPSLSFLVALDTGSDLFWVPCDCTSCTKYLSTNSGARLNLNIYSPKASSTSKSIPCNTSSGAHSACPYQVEYLSNNTSSSGVLVKDVLHLITEQNPSEVVDAPITLGCGMVQTGSFLDGAAPNGLFGLGMANSSVPSILSSLRIAANSFSMCFGDDGIGRIRFGDKGSPKQDKTPFNINQLHPTYNISVAGITVETNRSNIEFNAIFDSGTSFTYLNDPAYTLLSESFDLHAQDRRLPSDPAIPFEYCYNISAAQTSIMLPNVNLTMKGGSLYPVLDPIVVVSGENDVRYCLGIVRSPDINIIGQNFMTGYNIIFDRENLVLGWEKSNCYNVQGSSTVPFKPPNNTVVPPATAAEPRAITPEATRNTRNGSPNSEAPQPSIVLSSRFSVVACTLFILFVHLIAIF